MRDEIIELLNKYGPISFDALKNFLHADNEELAKIIFELEDNEIFKIGKNYHLIDNKKIAKGKIVDKNGHAFLYVNKDSYFIDDSMRGKSFDKDIVIAHIFEEKGRKCASILKVVEHTNVEIVCECKKTIVDSKRLFKVVDTNSTYSDVLVPINKIKGATNGDLCLVKLSYLKTGILGEVTKIIGHKNDIGSDILACVASAHVPYIFNDDVYKEANKIEDYVNSCNLVGRKDFTNDLVITIDGDDSKDYDDAVNVKKAHNGNFILSVHIADVSHYVLENTAIDKEALERGNSIYLVDRVIPMLPEKLSNGICSLNEGEIRLTLSCVMEIDKHGNLLSSNIYKGYIKSLHRMTYSNVNKILVLKDEKLIQKYYDIYPMLLQMNELREILSKKRKQRGSLDFDVPEIKIEVDNNGAPIMIKKRERDIAEMIIEEFMLKANETVAETLFHLEYPCVYRVHEEPDIEKLKAINNIIKSSNLKFSHIDKNITPLMVQKVMDQISIEDAKDAINTLLLRAMSKARYDSRSLGHFGLAAKYYCHFTSPIRRYSDLMVHRIIHDLLIDVQDFEDSINHFNKVIDEVSMQVSLTERKAIELERLVDDMKTAEYMEKRIGNIYKGVISTITSFGLFVMLESGIEGLVHIKNMPDIYDFNEKEMKLVGYYSKDVYSIGESVKVRVISASKEKRQIDFMLLEHKKGR